MSTLRRVSRVVAALAIVVAACQRTPKSATPNHDSVEAANGRDSLASAPLPTVGSDDVEVFPASELTQVADELADGSANGDSTAVRAARRYVETRRTSSGVPEVHDDWMDVTLVQSGRATLLAGGRAEGTRATSAGEHRGGTIRGGKTRVVSTGDSFIIPAGVPHQYQVAPGDSIRYLTIKVARHAPPR